MGGRGASSKASKTDAVVARNKAIQAAKAAGGAGGGGGSKTDQVVARAKAKASTRAKSDAVQVSQLKKDAASYKTKSKAEMAAIVKRSRRVSDLRGIGKSMLTQMALEDKYGRRIYEKAL